MSILSAPAELCLLRENSTRDKTRVRDPFESISAAVIAAPLNEILPTSPSDNAAALGFALGWAIASTKFNAEKGLIFWAAPERDFFENGLPNAEGLVQFGIELDRLLMVRANSQLDALWATEQALTTPETTALCAISSSKKALSLTATRRLLLTAEKHKTRCILLRFDAAGTSAAWSRWNISAAPSQGFARELGAPAFNANLVRNRAGISNQSFNLHWDINSHAFRQQQGKHNIAMDGFMVSTPADRPAHAQTRSAA